MSDNATTDPSIDWRNLLHRYMWHVGREEGATFIPSPSCDLDYFTEAEIRLLEQMDKEPPSAHS